MFLKKQGTLILLLLSGYINSYAQFGIGAGYTSGTFLEKYGRMQDGVNFNISRKNKRQTLVFGVSYYPAISYARENMVLYQINTGAPSNAMATVTAQRTIGDIYGEIFIDFYRPDKNISLYVLGGLGVVVRKADYIVGPFDAKKFYVDEYRLYDYSMYEAPLLNLSLNAGAGTRYDHGLLSFYAEVKTTPVLNLANDNYYPMFVCLRTGVILNIRQKKLFEVEPDIIR